MLVYFPLFPLSVSSMLVCIPLFPVSVSPRLFIFLSFLSQSPLVSVSPSACMDPTIAISLFLYPYISATGRGPNV
jgi:hypothetical protein